MMTIIHKKEGGVPVEIARKNWEDQSEYTKENWTILHEGSPIVLLKKKSGTDEYQEDKLFDLDLTKMLFERHGDEYKVIDYLNAKIKPVVPIDRNKLGDLYLEYFHLKEKVDAPRPMVKKNAESPSVREKTVREIDEEFEQINKEMLELEPLNIDEGLFDMNKNEGIIKKRWNADWLMQIFVTLLFAQGAFIGGYYYRSSIYMSVSTIQIILLSALMLLAFVSGYFLNRFFKKN